MPDTLRDDIRRALNDHVDPDTFEECACAVLRADIPGLTPMRGGGDSGRDGTFVDRDGRTGWLVVTAGRQPLANLRKNLSTLRAAGGSGSIVFATSRPITPRTWDKLASIAGELGFKLLNVFDQAAFTDRLEASPYWCQRLLHLPGTAMALSLYPRSRRPPVGNTIIGRRRSLRWLRETPGDLVLLGQPGSGKTRLLSRLVKTDGALFLVDGSDRTAIMQALRRHAPRILIVDDAHADVLAMLHHLREDTNASFRIIAAGWPHDRHSLRESLRLTTRSTRTLDRLTRKQMVRVLRDAKIERPNWLVRELVEQAEGRPGLLASLVQSIRERDADEGVRRAGALTQLVDDLAKRIDASTAQVLAGFALGGSSGVSSQAVGTALRRDSLQLDRMLRDLAEGGVLLTPADGHAYVVTPAALREALVTHACGAIALHPLYEPLLEQVSLLHCLDVLVVAKLRGCRVPSSVIDLVYERALAQEPGQRSALARSYARLGTREAVRALGDAPSAVLDDAKPFLANAPGPTLHSLIQAAASDEREHRDNNGHPLQAIRKWISENDGYSSDSFEDREQLLRAAERAAHSRQLSMAALRAGCEAMNIGIHVTELDVTQTTMTWRSGTISAGLASRLLPMWSRILGLLERAGARGWAAAIEALRGWRALGILGGTKESSDACEAGLRAVLPLFVPLATSEPAALAELKRLATLVELQIDEPLDADYVFLVDRFDTMSAEGPSAADGVHLRLEEWGPELAADKLLRAFSQAKLLERPTGAASYAAAVVASRVPARMAWVRALAARGLWGLTSHFLEHAARNNDAEWEAWAIERLAEAQATSTITAVAMGAAHAEALFEAVMANTPADVVSAQLGRWIVSIPIARMKRLLAHANDGIAIAAFQREWDHSAYRATNELGVREELRDAWCATALRVPASADSGILGFAFACRPDLAEDWLVARVLAGDWFYRADDYALRKCLAALDGDRRRRVLVKVGVEALGETVLNALVAEEDDLFELALTMSRQSKAFVRLSYRARPDGLELHHGRLDIALRHGTRPGDLAYDVFGLAHSYSGSSARYYREWMDEFDKLRQSASPGLAEVGRIGLQSASERRGEALRVERRRARYGGD